MNKIQKITSLNNYETRTFDMTVLSDGWALVDGREFKTRNGVGLKSNGEWYASTNHIKRRIN